MRRPEISYTVTELQFKTKNHVLKQVRKTVSFHWSQPLPQATISHFSQLMMRKKGPVTGFSLGRKRVKWNYVQCSGFLRLLKRLVSALLDLEY